MSIAHRVLRHSLFEFVDGGFEFVDHGLCPPGFLFCFSNDAHLRNIAVIYPALRHAVGPFLTMWVHLGQAALVLCLTMWVHLG